MPDLLPGAEFAGCRIEAVAGRGGMGIVYRATQLSLGRPVALKLITPDRAGDPGFRERFERESRIAAAIDHPNVIPVYAAGEEGGHLYLVMRYVQGTDLQHLLARERTVPPARAASIALQIGAALDAAHAVGLVHRDVKPANVLLSREHAYLADFGLSQVVGSDTRLTSTGQWIGTVDFMAPEQFEGGEADARADVYALGCVLFDALTGSVPYPRGTVPATMIAHLQEEPPRPSEHGAPDGFDRVIARALAKDPADRYPSAGDLGRAAQGAAEGRPVTESERVVARGAAAPVAPPRGRRADGGDQGRRGRGRRPGAVVGVRRDRGRAPTARGDRRDRGRHARRPRRPAASARSTSRGRRSRSATARAAAAAASPVPPRGWPSCSRPAPRSPRWPTATASTPRSCRARPSPTARWRISPGTSPTPTRARTPSTLGRLLTRDVERVVPGARQEGKDAVLTAYRRQFDDSETRSFELEDLEVQGGAAGRASGRYVATYRGEPDVTGAIAFNVLRDRGEPRIALISARQDVGS